MNNDPIDAILNAIEENRVVALGEKHGHIELHALILEILSDERAALLLDDIIVEWGNSLYQSEIDRYINGDPVPWDSVALAWQNTVVSPNTVWDSEVYANFYKGIRQINVHLNPDNKFRVLLADSPINWNLIESRKDVAPFFDRATSMADVIRTKSLLKGRKSLFIAGGLHVSKKVRTHYNKIGIPFSEITPIALVEFKNPGVTFVIQSFDKETVLNFEQYITDGKPMYINVSSDDNLRSIPASAVSSLRNRDGTKPDVYPEYILNDIVDAVILWNHEMVTRQEPSKEVFKNDSYWAELNRRSLIMRGEPMDASLIDR